MSLFEVPEDFEFPKYDSIINKIPVIGVVADIEYLTTPLVKCLENIDTLPDNVRLLTTESNYKSLVRQVPEDCTDSVDREENGYSIHYHSYNGSVYAYIYKPGVVIPQDSKYTSIGLKINSELTDGNYYVSEKQDFDYGSLYIAKNSPKCIRINIPTNWSKFDKSYLYKGNKTSEFD